MLVPVIFLEGGEVCVQIRSLRSIQERSLKKTSSQKGGGGEGFLVVKEHGRLGGESLQGKATEGDKGEICWEVGVSYRVVEEEG